MNPPPCAPASKSARLLTGPAAAAIILALFWAGMLASLRDKSLTFDEPANAAAGASYWRMGDYRLNPEAGALPQRVAGLPLALGQYRFPALDSAHWRAAEAPPLGYDYFFGLGNDARRMAGWGRAACGLMAVALGAIVWAWSRRLFGPWGGLISLLLYVLSPTILANGALMTSDMAAALFFAAATWAWWSVLERISPGRIAASAVLTGALFLSKMSAVLIVPVMAALALARLIDGRPLPAVWGSRGAAIRSRGGQAVAFLGAAAAHAVIVAAVIWACYGFRYAAMSHPTAADHLQFSWQNVLQEPASGVAAAPPDCSLRTLDFMRRHELLPEAWLYGLGVILNRTQFGIAFWNGRISEAGWPGYFPYAFLVKTPLAFFGVFALAVAGGICSRRRFYATLPLWVFLAVYWIAAVTSRLDIGHRYLLPVYAPLFVLGGASAAALGPRRWAGATLCGLLALLAAETAWRFPNYLAYFNGLVRPADAYRHLVDSSLDWGQDLPGARRYLDAHPDDGPFYFSYFGPGSPAYYGVTARPLYSFGARYVEGGADMLLVDLPTGASDDALSRLAAGRPDYDLMGVGQDGDRVFAVLVEKPDRLRLVAGTYLISATMLQPVHDWEVRGPWNARYEAVYRQLDREVQPFLNPDAGARRELLRRRGIEATRFLLYRFQEYRLAKLTAYLRRRRPDATIDYSILVYRLSEADVARAMALTDVGIGSSGVP